MPHPRPHLLGTFVWNKSVIMNEVENIIIELFNLPIPLVHSFKRTLALLSNNLIRFGISESFLLPRLLTKSRRCSWAFELCPQVSLPLALAACSTAWQHHLHQSLASLSSLHLHSRVDVIENTPEIFARV